MSSEMTSCVAEAWPVPTSAANHVHGPCKMAGASPAPLCRGSRTQLPLDCVFSPGSSPGRPAACSMPMILPEASIHPCPQIAQKLARHSDDHVRKPTEPFTMPLQSSRSPPLAVPHARTLKPPRPLSRSAPPPLPPLQPRPPQQPCPPSPPHPPQAAARPPSPRSPSPSPSSPPPLLPRPRLPRRRRPLPPSCPPTATARPSRTPGSARGARAPRARPPVPRPERPPAPL